MSKATGIQTFASKAAYGRKNLNGTPKQQAGAKDPFAAPQSGTVKGRANTHRTNLGNAGRANQATSRARAARNVAVNRSRAASATAAAQAATSYGVHAKKAAAGGSTNSKGSGNKAADGTNTDISTMTPAEIVAQAKQTVSAEYKSSYGDLGSESKQAQAIAAKQAIDNKAYEAWVGAQTQSILQQGSQADAQFAAQANAANVSLANTLNPQQSAAAVQAADNREGNVSNNATSTPLTTDLINKQNLDKVNQQNVNKAAITDVSTSGDLLKSSALNAESGVGNAIAAQHANFDTQMTKIAQARQNLNLSKIGDIAKEVSRLQGVQVQVQAAAAQNAIAEQAYGLNAQTEADNHQEAEDKIQATIKIAGMDAKKYFAGLNNARAIAKYDQMGENARAKLSSETSLSEAAQRNALGNKTYLLNVKKVGIAKASEIYKETHPNAGSSSNTPNLHPDGSPLTVEEEQSKFDTINQTTALINHYLTLGAAANGGKGIPDRGKLIYQAMLSGGQITVNGKPVTISAVPKALLNAAFTMSQARNGVLTAGEVAALRNIGLRDVTSKITR